MKRDDFGNRMKEYEARESGRRFLPLLPIYARIDGKCFSRFTKGMERPYDKHMTYCMQETTRRLVEETNACIGYTQSDEISLCWHSTEPKSQVFFDGRIQKMTSVLASMTTLFFYETALNEIPDYLSGTPPFFDCRVFQLPTTWECANAFLWRVNDATKNSISMAARTVYSHKQLHQKSGNEMQEMLFQKGINWNDYPTFFKEGSWFQRTKMEKELSPEELEKIPEQHRPDGPVWRTVVRELELKAPFSKVLNREDVILRGASPLYFETDIEEPRRFRDMEPILSA